MTDYSKLSDGVLEPWFANFVDVVVANAATLGIDAAEQAELEAARDGFSTSRTARANAAAAAKSATVDKNNNRSNVLGFVGLYNNIWQADPSVPETLIADLGLTIHDKTPSTIGVFTPVDFVASGNGNGTVRMRWGRNGNKRGCTFLIELSYDSGATWQIVGGTTKAKKTLTGVSIRPTAFRVRAERNGRTGSPSSTSSVFVPAGEAEPVEPPIELVA